MIRIAIAEDNKHAAEQLGHLIAEWFEENGGKFQIDTFKDGLDFLDRYKPCYQIVFMDIDMPFISGIETAKRLRAIDSEIVLIFVTNMAQFAVQGYELDALDFMVKPLQRNVFFRKFTRAMERMKRREQVYVNIKSGSKTLRFALQDIYYIEVEGHNVTYHTASGDIQTRDSLGALEKQFEGLSLVRCNNCFMVNLQHVNCIEKDLATVAGTEIAISRSRKKEFMNKFAEYLNER